MTTYRVELPTKYLAAANLFAAGKDTREWLTGVWVKPDSKLLTASDGHRLIAINAEQSWCGELVTCAPFLVPKLLISQHLKGKKKEHVRSRIEVDMEKQLISLAILDQFGEIVTFHTDRLPTEKYRSWKNMIPRDAIPMNHQRPNMFNPAYLADLNKAVQLLHDDVVQLPRIRSTTTDSPTLFDDGPDGCMLAVIMPIRAYDSEAECPLWVTQL